MADPPFRGGNASNRRSCGPGDGIFGQYETDTREFVVGNLVDQKPVDELLSSDCIWRDVLFVPSAARGSLSLQDSVLDNREGEKRATTFRRKILNGEDGLSGIDHRSELLVTVEPVVWQQDDVLRAGISSSCSSGLPRVHRFQCPKGLKSPEARISCPDAVQIASIPTRKACWRRKSHWPIRGWMLFDGVAEDVREDARLPVDGLLGS